MCLFYDHPWANTWALMIFIIASITDAYDGYYARKYDQITPEGKFLDPLADKILVTSAFMSFALLDVVEFWMIGLIIFRDLFVTGLRMAMERKGLSMVTSTVAKAKTATQMTIIIFILIVLGLKGLSFKWSMPILDIISQYQLVYNLTFFATVFTVFTGISYIYSNRTLIQKFLQSE